MRNPTYDPPEMGCVLALTGVPGGGNRIHDRSPYGNHGQLIGAGWKKLPGGLWQLTFDGVDDVVECPHSESLSIVDSITIVTWVKRAALNHRDILLAKREGGTGNVSFQFEVTADGGHVDTLWFGYQDASGHWEEPAYSQRTMDTAWHQVAVTRTPKAIRFFIDGRLDANQYTPAYPMDAPNTHWVGIGAVTWLTHFTGGVAIPRLFNRGLTAIELQDMFTEEKTLF